MYTTDLKYGCQLMPAHYTVLVEGGYVKPVDGIITYSIYNESDDLPKGRTHQVIDAVMEHIQWCLDEVRPKGRRITIKKVAEGGQVKHIFTPRNHSDFKVKGHHVQCNYLFDGIGGSLAHAYPPPMSEIHYDQDEIHTDNPYIFDIPLYTIALHETYHAFNFGHSKYKKAIMYSQYLGIKIMPHFDDLRGWQELYGHVKRRLPAPPAQLIDVDYTDLLARCAELNGIHESDPYVERLIHDVFPGYDTSKVAWCGIGAHNLYHGAGHITPKGYALARHWMFIGQPALVPIAGDAVIYWRESINSWKGHVSLMIRPNDRPGKDYVFGANQNDTFSFQHRSQSRILDMRRIPKRNQLAA